MKYKQIANELDELVKVMDEETNFICQRIEFIQCGQLNKAQFIEEKVLPIIQATIRKMIIRLEKLLSNNNER